MVKRKFVNLEIQHVLSKKKTWEMCINVYMKNIALKKILKLCKTLKISYILV